MTEFLRNCWYGLAWSEELDAKPLVTRTVLNMKLIVFRGANGEPGALLDRCPHRFAPLSLGKVVDGVVRCGYHGLGFSTQGKCVSNLFGAPPQKASVRSFPVVERDRMIWIWPGDPEAADPSKIPDYAFQNEHKDGVDWVIFGYTQMNTHYEIETDNLMDLSHIETLHAGSFGGKSVIQQGQYELRALESEIHSNWWMPSVPVHDRQTGKPTGQRIDHFLDMRWNAPSCMRLHVGFLPEGVHRARAKGPREDLSGQFSAHILTPETATSTHYFWSAKRPAGPGVELDRERGRALFKLAFELEDKPMLEAVQANMVTDFWGERPVILPNDTGALRARRRLAKLIATERGVHTPSDAVSQLEGADE